MLGQKEHCLRNKPSWKAVEDFFESVVLRKLHHGGQKLHKIVDKHHLGSEFIEFLRSGDDENVQLLA